MLLGMLLLMALVMVACSFLRHSHHGTWFDRWDPYDHKIPWDREHRKRWRVK